MQEGKHNFQTQPRAQSVSSRGDGSNKGNKDNKVQIKENDESVRIKGNDESLQLVELLFAQEQIALADREYAQRMAQMDDKEEEQRMRDDAELAMKFQAEEEQKMSEDAELARKFQAEEDQKQRDFQADQEMVQRMQTSYGEPFECVICGDSLPHEYVFKVKSCVQGEHGECCRECMRDNVKNEYKESAKFPPRCPFAGVGCKARLEQGEIMDCLEPDEQLDYMAKELQMFAKQTAGFKSCIQPDCKGVVEMEEGVVKFVCPICQYQEM
jgi:hypothetical protein